MGNKQDDLELIIYNNIEDIMIEEILMVGEQTTMQKFLQSTKVALKEIIQTNKKLIKIKSEISEKTIQEMINDIAHREPMYGFDGFLQTVKNEFLQGQEKEKDEIIQKIDLEKLKQDTFEIITKALKSQGYLKKKKGFG